MIGIVFIIKFITSLIMRTVIKNNFLKNIYLSIIFLIISFLITIINIEKYEINFINIQWPFNSSFVFYNLFNGLTLYNYGNVAFINFFNFPEILAIYLLSLFFPVYLQEIFLLSFLQFISMYYFYKLSKYYIFNFLDDDHIKTFVSSLSSVLIVFSFASQILYWWNFIPQGFFLIAFGSGMFYYTMKFFDYYLNNNKINKKYLIFIMIFSSLSISVNTPFNISFIWMFIIFTGLFFIRYVNKYKIKNIKKIFLGYIIIIFLILLANIWYILPTLIEGYYVPSLVSPNNNENLFIFYLASDINLLKIFTFSYSTSQYSYPSIGTYIFSAYGKVISYIIFPAILFGIISLNKKTNKRYFYILFIYFLTFLFIIGARGPFKYVYLDVIFKNGALFTGLRNPYTALIFSFNTLYIIVLIFSALRFIDYLKNHYKNHNFINIKKYKTSKLKLISVFIIFIIVIMPVLSTSSSIYLGEAIPVSPLHARVIVPEYEIETADYIRNHLNNNYAYLFPGGFINQSWSHGYDAFDILPNLIGSNYVIDSPTNNISSDMYNYIKLGETYEIPNFASTLSDLGIKYIVIEGNVTATPYWSYTYTPNYSSILYSLNNTYGIKFVNKFGNNYVYENKINASIIYIPKEDINYKNYTNYIIPQLNITQNFYNDTIKNYNLSPDNYINITYNNEICIIINGTYRNITDKLEGKLPFSYASWGPPSIFNQYPLNINTSNYNYMTIKFETNKNTAFNIFAITTKNTTGGNIYVYNLAKSENIYDLFGNYNSLGTGDNKLNPAYGADWCNDNNVTTMTINLNEITNKNIYKLVFSFLPVINGTGDNLPINEWPEYENLTIYSIELGNNVFFNHYGEYTNNTTYLSKNMVDLNANISYNIIKNEDFNINIYYNKNNDKPIPIILAENYENGWKIAYNKNVSNAKIINNNYSTEILIYPNNKGSNIEINMYFSGNNIFHRILLYSLLIYIIPLIMLMIPVNNLKIYSKIKRRHKNE